MLTTNLLFILGAGASIPYGFPSGRKLTDEIIGGLGGQNLSFARDIIEYGFDWKQLNEFRAHLVYSGRYSIDAFIVDRPEFTEVGKVCIARGLIPYEKLGYLGRSNDANWYRYLFERWQMKPENIGENRLAFVTFNYDRSLEKYLYTAFKYSYNLSDNDAASIVKKIPIVHVHGLLGQLVELDSAGRPYDETVNRRWLQECASNIRIISEVVDTSAEIQAAHNLIKQSHTICFLGFGYHQINLHRLFPAPIHLLQSRLFGTTLGMPPSEIVQVQAHFSERLVAGNFDALQALQTWSLFG